MIQPLTKDATAFAETRIDDEIVVMNLSSGDFFSLRDSGAAIWDLIDGTRDRAAVLADLARDFDAGEADLAADLDAFLAELRGNGLLSGS